MSSRLKISVSKGELARALALVEELTGQLTEAQDDLAAAQASIRQLIRVSNTGDTGTGR